MPRPIRAIAGNSRGQLLYTGELNPAAAHLIRAANIAGAASLAASASAAALRQALHQGAIDFLVNSLDEALRILKNEIRKRQPVAAAVSAAPEIITQELLERGVLPNLLPPDSAQNPAAFAAFIAQGARPLPQLLPDPRRSVSLAAAASCPLHLAIPPPTPTVPRTSKPSFWPIFRQIKSRPALAPSLRPLS